MTNVSSFLSVEKVHDDTVSIDLAAVLVCDDRVVVVEDDDDDTLAIWVPELLSKRFEVLIRKSVLILLLWLESSMSSFRLLVAVAAAVAAAASVDDDGDDDDRLPTLPIFLLLRVVWDVLLAAWVSSLPVPTSNETNEVV